MGSCRVSPGFPRVETGPGPVPVNPKALEACPTCPPCHVADWLLAATLAANLVIGCGKSWEGKGMVQKDLMESSCT